MSLQKVLVVEDDGLSVEVIKLVLNNICDLYFADNGLKAIEMVKADNFAIILMDVGLGYGMSGIETAQEIRKLENYKKTPIVALTAYAMDGDKENFLSQGMTHYLSKPYEIKDLKNLVREILQKVIEEG